MMIFYLLMFGCSLCAIFIGRTLRQMHGVEYRPDAMPDGFFRNIPWYSIVLEGLGYAMALGCVVGICRALFFGNPSTP